MKKFFVTLSAIFFLAVMIGKVFAQAATQEKKVSVSYTWIRIPGPGSNQLAIWVEDAKGNYVSTVYASRFTATGGYVTRPVSLSQWTEKSDWKNASKGEIDAVTGSTPQPGTQTVIWSGKDKYGKVVPNGSYTLKMEANILNEKKMFYSCVVIIGGPAQKPKGEITYSEPGLESGNVLFKDVVVEYK